MMPIDTFELRLSPALSAAASPKVPVPGMVNMQQERQRFAAVPPLGDQS